MLTEMKEKSEAMEEKRQRERKEDKEEMKAVASEIKDGVKKEIDDVLKPWQERTLRVEESMAGLGEQVKRLTEELRQVKEQMPCGKGEGKSYANVTRRSGGGALTGANTVPIGGGRTQGEEEQVEVEKGEVEQEEVQQREKERVERERIRGLLADARRVVGLKPIDKKHVEHTKRRLKEIEGETEEDKERRAKEGTVMLFLKCELKMKEEDIGKLEIKKIFAPAKVEWNTLYVELGSWEQAKFLLSFTTFLRRNTTGEDRLEVVNYIPRDLFERFKAITAVGNQARISSGKTISFRVGFGSDDFILQQKPKGSRGWGPPVPLPADLPPFQHHIHLPRGARSPGEAPGRPAMTPEQQERKRDREGASPTGSTPVSKKTFEQRLEEAGLVGSPTITPTKPGEGLLAAPARPDLGNITSVTPALTRSKKSQGE